jgi:putative ABC transport system ATP-binding protein
MSSPQPPAIEAIDVVKTFDRGVLRPLDGASLTVAKGEWVALTGPSGCGKSTLLHLIAALDVPTSGRILVNGRDLSRIRDLDGYRRREVGLVFQLHNLLPMLSAIQNVEVAMLGTGRSPGEQRDRAMELLRAVGLEKRAKTRPPALSGGERQRLATARALANKPSILLADEPTGSLDSQASKGVLGLLGAIRAETGLTILMVTHDPAVAAAADRIIYMRDGRVVEQPAG